MELFKENSRSVALTQKNFIASVAEVFFIQGDELILLVVPENGSTVEVFLLNSSVEEKTIQISLR